MPQIRATPLSGEVFMVFGNLVLDDCSNKDR